jgi:hypothetical protein
LGGIAWTLTGSHYDIDIEFKDEMNLAEKIKVSEKITAALKQIQCPVILNPVQLQGLDLDIIFQVLQWLVKKLLETRDEISSRNKSYARSYLQTKSLIKSINEEKTTGVHQQSSTKKLDNSNSDIDSLLSDIKYNYIKTGRQFRPTNKTKIDYNDPLRIYFALIEYGLNKDLSFQRTLIDLLKKKNMMGEKKDDTSKKEIKEANQENTISGTLNKMNTYIDSRRSTVTSQQGGKQQVENSLLPSTGQQKETAAQSAALTTEEKKTLDDIINTNITEVAANKNFHRINTSVIEEIFSDNIDSIVNEIDKFENQKEDESVDRIKIMIKEKERLDLNKQNILFQIKEYEAESENLERKIQTDIEDISTQNEEINKLASSLQENENNFEKLNNQIKFAKIEEEKMLNIGEKIRQKEELKSAIAKFKKDCLEEKNNYDLQIGNFEKKIEKMGDSQNTHVFEEIDKNYQMEYEKLLNRKKDLFDQNKIINLLTRKIQVSPSKLELIQYQKRFQELYDQINQVSEKSKNILNDINSREEVKKLINQKLEMFVQLKDAYKNSKSKKDKENFKESLNSILESLSESLKRSTEKLRNFNKQIEDNQSKLNELQLYENKYMKLIKEYNKEYNKYNKGYN